MGKRTAIVGATGAVGTTMLSILEERDFPVSDLRLMASSKSAGRVVPTKWGDVTVENLATADPSGIDVALFSAGGGRSKEYAPKFAAAGAVVIDNSSAFRQEPDVPLVVAQVNDEAIRDGYLHAKGLTVRWPDGSERKSDSLIRITVNGTDRRVVFSQPGIPVYADHLRYRRN